MSSATFSIPLTPSQESVIACNLGAISTDERAGHIDRAKQLLFAPNVERYALANGTAWRLGIEHYADVMHFISNERRCCSFFSFEVEVMREREAIWLRITGGVNVAEFLQLELDAQDAPPALSATSMPTSISREYAIFCDLTAITREEEQALTALWNRLLYTACEERRELPDGYAFRFAADHYDGLVQFTEGDSRCCGFWTHTIEVTPNAEALWLRITGSDDAKAALAAELERLQAEIIQDESKA